MTVKLTMPVVTLARPCSSVIVYWKEAVPTKPVVGVKVKVPLPLLTIAPLVALLTPVMVRLISAPSGSTSLPSSCAAVKVIGVLPVIEGIKSSKAIGVTWTEPRDERDAVQRVGDRDAGGVGVPSVGDADPGEDDIAGIEQAVAVLVGEQGGDVRVAVMLTAIST